MLNVSRREFLKRSAAVAGGLAVAPAAVAAACAGKTGGY